MCEKTVAERAREVATASVRTELVEATVNAMVEEIMERAGRGSTSTSFKLFYHTQWMETVYSNGTTWWDAKDHMDEHGMKVTITHIEKEVILSTMIEYGLRVSRDAMDHRYYNFTW